MKSDRHRLCYLASPYSRYSTIHAAARDISVIAGKLIRAGYSVLSPIAHCHSIAIHSDLDPFDHSLWMKVDEAYMEVCDALIVVMLDGWKRSDGVAEEIKIFAAAGKPVYYLNPANMKIVRA